MCNDNVSLSSQKILYPFPATLISDSTLSVSVFQSTCAVVLGKIVRNEDLTSQEETLHTVYATRLKRL